MTWLTNLIANIALHFETASVGRFNRWSKFLGRKMFLGLIAMLLLTTAFLTAILCALAWSGVEAMKAFGTDLWSLYVTGIAGLYGGAVAGNAMEHNANAKVAVANGTPVPIADPPTTP